MPGWLKFRLARWLKIRLTNTTLLLERGVSPKVVQERLGHSDISMTMNRYAHVTSTMQENAAGLMGPLLR